MLFKVLTFCWQLCIKSLEKPLDGSKNFFAKTFSEDNLRLSISVRVEGIQIGITLNEPHKIYVFRV